METCPSFLLAFLLAFFTGLFFWPDGYWDAAMAA
jgi:hypothetical protein